MNVNEISYKLIISNLYVLNRVIYWIKEEDVYMRFVIVTGLSGAGKSQATKSLEDIGYFCVDNLPPKLITKFAEACRQSDGNIDKVALVIDIRGGVFFDDLFESLKYLKKNEFKYEILFLDASDEVLSKKI